ncbi:hypothetical protein SLEP1_g29085 [Rubroshorea leprosula]|uniref:Cystatin domain-containing protein n=1 Tax=Rubroshorea leprosula TaxID=152421 RepID=A0AAV5K668_9ROSI|nr:hypothetical protein SLEP1_g29085 [Rubroshorea leprosula]
MQSRFCFLIFSVSLLLLSLVGSGVGDVAIPGGWEPIKDLNDAHVKEIAEFAVSEYNKQSNTTLKLNRIVKGEQQVVEGMKYRLTLNASDGAETKSYEATVWERLSPESRQLISFKPAS